MLIHLPLASSECHRTSQRRRSEASEFPDDLWEAARRVAADNGETITEVLLRALRQYVRDHPQQTD